MGRTAPVVLVAGIVALAGCGGPSRAGQLKPLTPSEAKKLVRSIQVSCHVPGRVLLRYVKPEVHGNGGESEWCVERAKAYQVVARDLRCPRRTHVRIDFARHRVRCVRRPGLQTNPAAR